MANLIDVHIIHLPNENKEWWAECEASLVGHPINIFHVDGTVGDIFVGREAGYRQGTAPYVSFVDPDDIVMPGAFQACLDAIQSGDYSGVYTMSEVIQEGQPIKPFHEFREWTLQNSIYNLTEIHQICVKHRDMVIDVFDNHREDFDEFRLASVEFVVNAHLMTKKPFKAIDMVGYRWRNHNAGCHHAARMNQKNQYDTLNRIYRKAIP